MVILKATSFLEGHKMNTRWTQDEHLELLVSLLISDYTKSGTVNATSLWCLGNYQKGGITFDDHSYSLCVKTPFTQIFLWFFFWIFCLEIVVMFPFERFKMALERSKLGLKIFRMAKNTKLHLNWLVAWHTM